MAVCLKASWFSVAVYGLSHRKVLATLSFIAAWACVYVTHLSEGSGVVRAVATVNGVATGTLAQRSRPGSGSSSSSGSN